MTAGAAAVAEQEAVAHLTPEHWEAANRDLVAKALAEFAHERLIEPRREPDGRYAVAGDDGAVTYRFAAEVLALDHWQIDASTLSRRRGDEQLGLDALDLEVRRTVRDHRSTPTAQEETG